MTIPLSPAVHTLTAAAQELDRIDDLAHFGARFHPAEGVIAYLDGNSLGRPLRATDDHLRDFIRSEWGTRLIRSWDEKWMDLPVTIGDRLGRIALGAAPGQTVVADSTTVLLYKLIRAAVEARPRRDEIVIEAGNFPTDRFIVEGIARESGRTVRWVEPDPVRGVSTEDVSAAVSPRTALVVLSHVDYRSGALADMAAITAVVKATGAIMLWDLCHSVGVVPMELDAWGVDIAVSCTYKYLNGGPGAPAFAYVRAEHHDALRQPIQGWMGAADVFGMGSAYEPAAGIRRFISGTPPILAMLPLTGMLDLIEEASVERIRAKSVSLTNFAIDAYDALLADKDVRLASPRDPHGRGSHITLGHASFGPLTQQLWSTGVIPDFRFPDGIRIGLSPLSTSHQEALAGVRAIAERMED
ncbi:Kynureninase [Microbacterium lemovicicum]|uniref:Kynureninase n=1 Tax=Microbacterium lemovicicum TaxID=1072463 RepID=A0A3Q9IWJ6_9MICO|nr:aminotransferase class V-fold PLP-dependent enzyme [Microbacterium lemovicicum]AZS35702.1 Kynureninase [Microbacterium lemovicicum]